MSQPLSAAALILILAVTLVSAGCQVVGAGGTPKEPSPQERWKTSDAMRVYVGTYTRDKGKGIYLYDFDTKSGALKQVGVAAETSNPSFLAPTPDYKHLYAVGEMTEVDSGGKKSGVLRAFAVDPSTGMLTLLNQESTGGTGPCHVSLDSRGRFAFVANYGSGTVASLPVQPDGKLAEPASVIQHEGTGPNDKRQTGPHAHGIWPSPDDRFVLACDLGLDKVLVYKLDPASGKLTPNDPPSGSVPPGAGARHAAFSPDGKFLYVINEMGNSVTAFAWDAKRGALNEVQTVTTLPEGHKETSHCAEIVMHPSGKFVYGSNRGHDSIAAFTVDPKTGKLTPAGHTPLGSGNWPRNFNVDPSGRWLIAAGEKSDTLQVFKIDEKTGGLTQVGEKVECPAPACVVFAPAGK